MKFLSSLLLELRERIRGGRREGGEGENERSGR